MLTADDDPAEAAEARSFWSRPEVVEAMLEQLDGYWGTWVSRWIGWDVAVGTDGLVHLRRTERRKGVTALGGMLTLGILAEERKGQRTRAEILAEVQSTYADLEAEIVQEVEIEPGRLRPRRASYHARKRWPGQEDGTHEWHEESFDWDRAIGCGDRSGDPPPRPTLTTERVTE